MDSEGNLQRATRMVWDLFKPLPRGSKGLAQSVACMGGKVQLGDAVTLDHGLRIPVVGSEGFLNTSLMQDREREATVLFIGGGSEPCLLLAPGGKIVEAFPRQFSIARLRLKEREQAQLEEQRRQHAPSPERDESSSYYSSWARSLNE